MPYQEPVERGAIEIITHTHRSYVKGIAGVWWWLQQRGCPIWGQHPTVDTQHILFRVGTRGVNEETLSKVTASFCNLEKKHPLSVTADLVSVTLALRLPGKQK